MLTENLCPNPGIRLHIVTFQGWTEWMSYIDRSRSGRTDLKSRRHHDAGYSSQDRSVRVGLDQRKSIRGEQTMEIITWLSDLLFVRRKNFQCVGQEIDSCPQLVMNSGCYESLHLCKKCCLTSHRQKATLVVSSLFPYGWEDGFGGWRPELLQLSTLCRFNVLREALISLDPSNFVTRSDGSRSQ